MNVLWSELSSRLLSPKLWKGFAPPVAGRFQTQAGNPAVGFFDDFTSFAGLVASNVGRYHSEGNNYLSYETNSTSIINVALTPTPASVAPTSVGAIILTPTTTDGDTVALQYGGSVTAPYGCFPFSVIPKMSGDLVFETRLKVASVTAARGNFYVGLAGAAGVAPIATAVPITSSDAFVTTLSLLGFGRLTAGTTNVDLFYERAGGTVGTIASVGTMAVDTYIKLGFRWDAITQIVTPYIDGEPVAVAKRTTKAIAAATPWPNDYMAPIAVVEEIATAACTLTMDWWACAQLIE